MNQITNIRNKDIINPKNNQIMKFLNQHHYIRWGWLAALQTDIELLQPREDYQPIPVQDHNNIWIEYYGF